MRGSRTRGSSTPTLRSSGCATSSPVRSTTSIREASFDLGPSVAALEARLKEDKGLRRLPAKFSFVVDALGRLPLGDVEADIRFEALRDGALAVYLARRRCAGGAMRAGRGRRRRRAARALHSSPLPAVAKRRRAGCARWSSGQALPHCSRRRVARRRRRARSQRRALLRRDPRRARQFGAAFVVGAAAPFGDIDAVRFRTLVERARALGASWSKAHALARFSDRRPRPARLQNRWFMRWPSLDSSSMRTIRVCASPLARARRPARMGIEACAMTRRAGLRCFRSGTASFCMSAAAPRDAPDLRRLRRL